MFIDIELTPNPDTFKFMPGRSLIESGTANFFSLEEASSSPLAIALFGLSGVAGVFIAYHFVSVTKKPEKDWDDLKPEVLECLQAFFQSGAPVMSEEGVSASSDTAIGDDPEDAEIVAQIETLLEDKVRPAVAGDGGDIVYKGFREGVVYLQMQGACAGCPSSTMTLKHGIENLLKYYVPEVSEVRAVE